MTIAVRTISQLYWLNLLLLPILTLPVTAKQRVAIIPGNQPEEGIDSYGGKDFESFKMRVISFSGKVSVGL